MFTSFTGSTVAAATLPSKVWSIFSVALVASATSGNTGYALAPYYELSASDDGVYILYCDVNRRIWLSTDSGVTWVVQLSNATTGRSCHISSTGQYMTIGPSSGTPWWSNDYGATWKQLTASGGPGSANSTGTKVSDDGETLITGTNSYAGLYVCRNCSAGTNTWSRYTTSVRVYSCFMSRDGQNIYYHADQTSYYTSTDNGSTWTTRTWPSSANSAHRCAASDDLTVLCSNAWTGTSINKIFFTNDYPTVLPVDINVSNFLKSGNLPNSGQFQTVLVSRTVNSFGGYTVVLFESTTTDSVLYSINSGVSFQRFGAANFANGSNFTFGWLSDNGHTLLLSASGSNNSLYRITFI